MTFDDLKEKFDEISDSDTSDGEKLMEAQKLLSEALMKHNAPAGEGDDKPKEKSEKEEKPDDDGDEKEDKDSMPAFGS